MRQYAAGSLLPGLLAMAVFASLTPTVPAQTTAGHVAATHPVQVELTTKLTSKNAKVGDAVDAKLLEAADLGGTTIPKGSKLTGKVTAAKPGEASVTVAFDTLECKGQAPKPVHADVLSLAPRRSLSESGPSGSSLPMRGTASQQAAQSGGSMSANEYQLADLPPGSTIKDVTLAAGPEAAASATISSSGKDFKIDSGSRMEVGLWTDKADK